MHLSVKGATEEMFSIIGELNVSNCLCMTDVSMGACSVFDDIEQVNFSLGITNHNEMTYFGEKPKTLIACLLTAYPSLNLLFRNETVLVSWFEVSRWVHIRKPLVVIELFPVKNTVRLKVLFLKSGLLYFLLFS